MRKLVGTGVQLAVGDTFIFKDQRQRVRPLINVRLEHLLYALAPLRTISGFTRLRQYPLLFRRRHQRQIPDKCVGLDGDASE